MNTEQQQRIKVEVSPEMASLVTQLQEEPKNAVYAERLVSAYRQDFERSLAYELVSGPPLGFESFMVAVKADVAKNPTLGEAIRNSPGSFLEALHLCAQCKLLPGSSHGLFYMIPRRRHGSLEVQAMIGYRGLCVMATRHRRVHSVEAFLVYKGETFEFDAGSGKLKHIISLDADHGEENIVAGYMRAIITEEASMHAVTDAPIYYVMSRQDILKRRAVSDAYKRAESSGKKDSPWHLWPDMMFRKTVLIGGLNHGSVPRDLGVGGAIAKEQEQDIPQEPLPLPKASQQENIRRTLGLSEPPPKFELAEQAVLAIQSAASMADLSRLADGWQHFEGIDANTIAEAYEARSKELGR